MHDNSVVGALKDLIDPELNPWELIVPDPGQQNPEVVELAVPDLGQRTEHKPDVIGGHEAIIAGYSIRYAKYAPESSANICFYWSEDLHGGSVKPIPACQHEHSRGGHMVGTKTPMTVGPVRYILTPGIAYQPADLQKRSHAAYPGTRRQSVE